MRWHAADPETALRAPATAAAPGAASASGGVLTRYNDWFALLDSQNKNNGTDATTANPAMRPGVVGGLLGGWCECKDYSDGDDSSTTNSSGNGSSSGSASDIDDCDDSDSDSDSSSNRVVSFSTNANDINSDDDGDVYYASAITTSKSRHLNANASDADADDTDDTDGDKDDDDDDCETAALAPSLLLARARRHSRPTPATTDVLTIALGTSESSRLVPTAHLRPQWAPPLPPAAARKFDSALPWGCPLLNFKNSKKKNKSSSIKSSSNNGDDLTGGLTKINAASKRRGMRRPIAACRRCSALLSTAGSAVGAVATENEFADTVASVLPSFHHYAVPVLTDLRFSSMHNPTGTVSTLSAALDNNHYNSTSLNSVAASISANASGQSVHSPLHSNSSGSASNLNSGGLSPPAPSPISSGAGAGIGLSTPGFGVSAGGVGGAGSGFYLKQGQKCPFCTPNIDNTSGHSNALLANSIASANATVTSGQFGPSVVVPAVTTTAPTAHGQQHPYPTPTDVSTLPHPHPLFAAPELTYTHVHAAAAGVGGVLRPGLGVSLAATPHTAGSCCPLCGGGPTVLALTPTPAADVWSYGMILYLAAFGDADALESKYSPASASSKGAAAAGSKSSKGAAGHWPPRIHYSLSATAAVTGGKNSSGSGGSASLNAGLSHGFVVIPPHPDPLLTDLLSKCLIVDPAQRATTDSLLQHPWFSSSTRDTPAPASLALQTPTVTPAVRLAAYQRTPTTAVAPAAVAAAAVQALGFVGTPSASVSPYYGAVAAPKGKRGRVRSFTTTAANSLRYSLTCSRSNNNSNSSAMNAGRSGVVPKLSRHVSPRLGIRLLTLAITPSLVPAAAALPAAPRLRPALIPSIPTSLASNPLCLSLALKDWLSASSVALLSRGGFSYGGVGSVRVRLHPAPMFPGGLAAVLFAIPKGSPAAAGTAGTVGSATGRGFVRNDMALSVGERMALDEEEVRAFLYRVNSL